LARFFTDDIVQVEYPKILNPEGAKSDLAALLRRSEEGKKFYPPKLMKFLPLLPKANA
jgi:hypothetical protein